MTLVPETPVQKKDCIIAECNKAPKGFKTARGLKGHMKKFHDVVIDALSPVAATARVFFDGGPDTLSIQGNSRGQINSPKVMSEGVYQCGKCPEQFRNRDEVKNHMDKEHDNAKAAETNDNLANSDKSNKNGDDNDTLNGDKDEEEVLNNFMEDIEDGDIAKGLEHRAAAAKIVQTFVDMAFKEMHPTEVVSNPSCHECVCKDENLEKLDKLLSEKDAKIEEKSATIRGLMETMRKNVKTRAIMQKRIDQGDKVKRKLAEKQNEIARLRVMVETKEALGQVQPMIVQNDTDKDAEQDIIVDVVLKKCKKCNFTAPNMNVLGLHMENDHQYEFDCSECSKKFPFKNQLKIHRREMHEEGTFSCFVCNNRFKTHKELKQHIQKKCKTQVTGSHMPIVHKHNDDILEEDEHRCPKCPKITNNQVSLINHMNTKHSAPKNKCDSCGQDFESKEVLITHIVENHTNKGTQVIPRHICKVCNVEVHGDEARNNHVCRKPENTCSFCKSSFYSKEAQRNHICDQHQYKTVDEQVRANKWKNIECTHGVSCYRARLGKCWFKHSQQVNTFPQRVQAQEQRQGPTEGQGQGQGSAQQQGHGQVLRHLQGQEQGQGWQQHRRQGRGWQQGRQGGQQGRQQEGQHGGQQGQGLDLAGRPPLYCKYQERCFKIQTCKFKHLAQVFPQENQGQNMQ